LPPDRCFALLDGSGLDQDVDVDCQVALSCS